MVHSSLGYPLPSITSLKRREIPSGSLLFEERISSMLGINSMKRVTRMATFYPLSLLNLLQIKWENHCFTYVILVPFCASVTTKRCACICFLSLVNIHELPFRSQLDAIPHEALSDKPFSNTYTDTNKPGMVLPCKFPVLIIILPSTCNVTTTY